MTNPRPARPSLSIVLPAYNEAGSLPSTLQEIESTLGTLGLRTEVLVVDDGSRDATPAVLRPWLARPGWRCIRLSRNFGKEAAICAGLDHARGDVVLLMDADGQHPPQMLGPMLAHWREGADMVCAVRTHRQDEPWTKRLGTRLFYAAVNQGSGPSIPVGAGDFRLMDAKVVSALRALPERNRFMKGLYAWVGFETRMLPYQPAPRRAGRSAFSVGRLARLAFAGVTAFSDWPLRVWSGIGGLVALGALAYGLFIIAEHLLFGHPVPGWPTIVTSLLFLGGVQLLSIGILGEYIARIYEEAKRRPLYLVGTESGGGWHGPEGAAADAVPGP